MRLIDCDALEKEMCSGCEYNKSKYANCDDCAIANAPTIDAVPVVRCKDCRHRHEYRNSEYIDCDCTDFYEMDDNDYCCFGERKEL